MSEWAFIDHVTRYMRRKGLGDRKAPTLWPSEASAVITNKHGEEQVVGKCRRATFFRYLCDSFSYDPDQFTVWAPLVKELKGSSLPPEPYMLWIWRAGDLYEEHCVGLAKSSGVYVDSQVPIYIKDYNVSGKIDLVVINPDTGLLSATEIKSVYGHNANSVLGSPGDRKSGQLGTPRESNLMQIALYQWWFASTHDEFESGRLVYGARDTGRFAEYRIDTTKPGEYQIGSGKNTIQYTGISPNQTRPETSPITIDSVLQQYKMVSDCLLSGEIPKRDFDLQYSDEKIQILFERGELTKAEDERVEKRLKQIEEGKTKLNKQIEKGDFYCRNCSYRNVCYDDTGNPKTI